MKKEVYLVVIFDKKTGNYKGTMHAAFKTRELARGYAAAFKTENHRMQTLKVPLITVYGEIRKPIKHFSVR